MTYRSLISVNDLKITAHCSEVVLNFELNFLCLEERITRELFFICLEEYY